MASGSPQPKAALAVSHVWPTWALGLTLRSSPRSEAPHETQAGHRRYKADDPASMRCLLAMSRVVVRPR
jgi:hypothetical protein